MSEPEQTSQEFLEHLFSCEYCAECSGDAQHHTVVSGFPFPGTFFAYCKFQPDEETGALHPVIVAFRKAEEEKGA